MYIVHYMKVHTWRLHVLTILRSGAVHAALTLHECFHLLRIAISLISTESQLTT